MCHDLVLAAQMPMQYHADQIDTLHRLQPSADNDDPEGSAHVLHSGHQVVGQQVRFKEIDKRSELKHNYAQSPTAHQPMHNADRDTEQKGKKWEEQCPTLEQ